MFKISPKIIPKMLNFRQIDPKISKKCVSYHKNPTHNKKCETCPQCWEEIINSDQNFALLILEMNRIKRRLGLRLSKAREHKYTMFQNIFSLLVGRVPKKHERNLKIKLTLYIRQLLRTDFQLTMK